MVFFSPHRDTNVTYFTSSQLDNASGAPLYATLNGFGFLVQFRQQVHVKMCGCLMMWGLKDRFLVLLQR